MKMRCYALTNKTQTSEEKEKQKNVSQMDLNLQFSNLSLKLVSMRNMPDREK